LGITLSDDQVVFRHRNPSEDCARFVNLIVQLHVFDDGLDHIFRILGIVDGIARCIA